MAYAHSTADSPQCKAPKYPDEFVVQPADLRARPICPNATTSIYTSPVDPYTHMFATCCKRWGCAYCARQKIRQLACWTAAAAPNRLLTLTVDPKNYLGPKAAWQATAPMVSELTRKLRLKFGSIEYLRVTELTKAGWPHYHLLVRSNYLPYEVVKKTWAALTGATIVDLRAVEKAFSAYWYLTKYLAKMHRKTWTERHVSYSRSFFPKEVRTRPQGVKLEYRSRSDDHPYKYFATNYWKKPIIRLAPHHYVLLQCSDTPAPNFSHWELGIPKEPLKKAPVQRNMIGEETQFQGENDAPPTTH
jgi:hypothetical protein